MKYIHFEVYHGKFMAVMAYIYLFDSTHLLASAVMESIGSWFTVACTGLVATLGIGISVKVVGTQAMKKFFD